MKTHRLTSTDAFVVFDLDEADVAIGVVRLAPKVLVDGAGWLARSMTYQFATFELHIGGASAGINAATPDRRTAAAAFVDEVRPLVEARRLLVDPGKGLGAADLAPLRELDVRSPHYWSEGPALTALGTAVAAEAAGGLDGRTVAVEGFDEGSLSLVEELGSRGAKVVAVGTARGSVTDPAGYPVGALRGAWADHGDDMIANLGTDVMPAPAVLGADADILFVGSRPGVVDHEGAKGIQARVVVPSRPIPVTAKALAVLGRAGVVVLPDFVTTAGALFAAFPPEGRSVEQVRDTVVRRVSHAVAEVLDHERGPLLGACERAEAFLASWQPTLPFGRPLA